MTRGVFVLAAALAVMTVLAGCQTQPENGYQPTMVKEYSVELEFVLIQVEPVPPSADATEIGAGMSPFFEPALLDERRDESRSGFVSYGPMILQPKPPTEPASEPAPAPGTGELPLEEPPPPPPPFQPVEEPVAPVPGEIERVIYSVRQSLAVGDKIEVSRSDNVSYMEEREGIPIEI